MQPNINSSGHSPAKWFLTVSDVRIPAPRRQISEAIIRAQASVPADRVIVRDHNSHSDEVIADGASVDLARGNVFYTVPRCEARPAAPCEAPPKLAFSVDDLVEEVVTGAQTGQSLSELFAIQPGRLLIRDLESPNDQPITPAAEVRFEDGPVFYTREGNRGEVDIKIDGKDYKVKPGEYAVPEIKRIGGVPPTLQLDQIVDQVFKPLSDTATVCIKGGEIFVSSPRTACSS